MGTRPDWDKLIDVETEAMLVLLKEGTYKVYDDFGKEVFRWESELGIPVEMAIDMNERFEEVMKDKNKRIIVMSSYIGAKTQHKIDSGISQERLKDLQERNTKRMLLVIDGDPLMYA